MTFYIKHKERDRWWIYDVENHQFAGTNEETDFIGGVQWFSLSEKNINDSVIGHLKCGDTVDEYKSLKDVFNHIKMKHAEYFV